MSPQPRSTLSRFAYPLQLLAACLGIGASLYLLVQHTRLKTGIQERASFCTLGTYADCDVVNVSDHSELLGLPLATLGALLYFFCLLLSLSTRQRDAGFSKVQKWLVWLSVTALAMDTYLTFVQIFSLKTICPMCVFTYLCTVTILITAARLASGKRGTLSSIKATLTEPIPTTGFPIALPSAVTGAVALLTFAGLLAVLPSYIRIKSQTYVMVENALEQFFLGWKDQPQKNIETTDKDGSAGNPSAHVKIVAFSDFECPHCRKAAFTLHTFLRTAKNRVQLSFKHFPLDSSCNPAVQYQLHPRACALAKLATCAQEKGKFWDFHDRIFLRLDPDDISEGIDAITPKLSSIFSKEEVDACLKSEKASQRLSADIKQAMRLGVSGTPAVYFNGKQVSIPLTVENLTRLLEIEEGSAR